MEGVRVENAVPFTSNLHSVAFVNVKFHLPGEFPLGYRIKVGLQKGGIAFGFDAAVEDACSKNVCLGPRSLLFRDSASEPQRHYPEISHQPDGMLLMLLYLHQDKAFYLPLNQAGVYLPVTEMVGQHYFHGV